LSLLQLTKDNYESELRGEKVLDTAMHRMFMGNPGTGKTTIAGLYGRILVELGYLSIGEVIVVGASKLTGQHVGSTAANVNKYMDMAKGKVLVIDEAYVLSTTIYGKEALDTLVERVQGTPGEDFAVILCGYEDNMRTMLREGNPGLSRRFRVEDAFRFADYTDQELTTIMLARAKGMSLYLTPELASEAVTKVLAKQRAKPNFGNVGAVNNLLEHGKERMMLRSIRTKQDGRFVLIAQDLFEEPPPGAAQSPLDGLMNADHIKQCVTSMQKRALVQKKKGNVDPKSLLKNYVFVGAPGTGKTTVARAFGQVFHGLGLLSSGDVVECKAMDLIGKYVGHSSAQMKLKMDEARGGVLFIDEAYGLNPNRSSFATDALEQLFGNLTDPKYQGNMIVILAGYTKDIDELLASNAGFPRRFTERIEFNDWAPDDCLQLLSKRCADEGVQLPVELHGKILQSFSELMQREGWGNAGDVITAHDKMSSSREDRCDDQGVIEGPYTEADVDQAFDTMLQQRKKKAVLNPWDAPAGLVPAVAGGKSAQPTAQHSPQQAFDAPVAQATATETATAEQGDRAEDVDDEEDVEETDEEKEAEVDNEEDEYVFADGKVDEDEEPPDDSMLFSSLDDALSEMGYDMYATRAILASGKLPAALVALVAKKQSRRPERVRPMLEAQCPVLLPKVDAMIQKIEAELEKQRLAREAIERADAAEKQRLKEEEQRRQQQAVMERVAMIGKCPMSFAWIKQGGGYRCAGGSHFVSDEQLTKLFK
jgi:AAA+ superfamily predicted ATPase